VGRAESRDGKEGGIKAGEKEATERRGRDGKSRKAPHQKPGTGNGTRKGISVRDASTGQKREKKVLPQGGGEKPAKQAGTEVPEMKPMPNGGGVREEVREGGRPRRRIKKRADGESIAGGERGLTKSKLQKQSQKLGCPAVVEKATWWGQKKKAN